MKRVDDINKKLWSLSDPEKKAHYPKFFKAGKGEYGEGDKFIGVVVPKLRILAKENLDLSYNEISELLKDEYHEVRNVALLILVYRFNKTKDESERKEIFDFYLANTKYINNWDLVDVSCRDIVGKYLLDKPKDVLYKLTKSKDLWEQRIAIVSTYGLIHESQFDDCVAISEIYLTHTHDLIHKASGWMLREAGKKDIDVLYKFLNKHSKKMPRTMLRYSIEKLSSDERRHYMER